MFFFQCYRLLRSLDTSVKKYRLDRSQKLLSPSKTFQAMTNLCVSSQNRRCEKPKMFIALCYASRESGLWKHFESTTLHRLIRNINLSSVVLGINLGLCQATNGRFYEHVVFRLFHELYGHKDGAAKYSLW